MQRQSRASECVRVYEYVGGCRSAIKGKQECVRACEDVLDCTIVCRDMRAHERLCQVV